MIGLRLFYLFICDSLISLLSALREIAALNSKDKLPYENLYLEKFYPYDVVVKNDILDKEIDNVKNNKNPKYSWGEPYKLGVIIGYKEIKLGKKPTKAVVAYFNTAEFSKPKIEVQNLDQITTLKSPLIEFGSKSQLSTYDTEIVYEDNGDELEELFNKFERKKDDTVH